MTNKLALSALLILLPSFALAADKPNVAKVASLDEFATCADRDFDLDACLAGLDAFVKKNPKQRFAAGKAVRAKMNHHLALPYFEAALTGKFDRKLCVDEDVRLAVVAGLGQPADGKGAVLARKLFGERCWDELRDPVKKAIAADPAGYLATNACAVLEQKKEPCAKAKAAAPAAVPARVWAELDPAKIAVEETAKVFSGNEGRTITIARVKGDPTVVLIRFAGIRGPWNNKVVLHRESETGTGFDYWTRVDGQDWVSVVARKTWGSELGYELHPRGDKGPYGVSFDADASRAAKPATLLADLKKR